MLSLKSYRNKMKAFPDLLNYAALIDDGIVLNKDGSLTAGWMYFGQDIESATHEERQDISARINMVLSALGNGWVTHQDAVRFSSQSYSPENQSHFPDPITKLIDQERRTQFESKESHFESAYALVVTYLPPSIKQSRASKLLVTDNTSQKRVSISQVLLDRFKQQLQDMEDGLKTVLKMTRLSSYEYKDKLGHTHLCDELLQYLHFCITGKNHPIVIPPCPMYLDTLIGSYEFYSGLTPKLNDSFISIVSIEGFPQNSYPNILAGLEHLPIPYRWNTRFIYMDTTEAIRHLKKYRRKWQQKVRGLMDQVFKTRSGIVNQDSLEMVQDSEQAISEASSQMVGYGYYTSVVVMMDSNIQALENHSRDICGLVRGLGFSCRVETVNAVESYMGSLPAHSVQNIRRPLLNTLNLADLMPTHSIWPGREVNPCPFYPPQSPPLLYAAAEGHCPFRLNLHVDDLGHTLILGPTGSGKSTLLALIAAQFRRYKGAQIFAFDKGRSLYPLCMAVGGHHYDVAGDEHSPSFCPLGDITSEQDQAWAEEWISSLLSLQGITVLPKHKNDIHTAMSLVMKSPYRTLTDFCTTLQDSMLKAALAHYTVSGAMGQVLDSDSDSLKGGFLKDGSLKDGSFEVFEIEALMNLGNKNLIPVLLYLFRHIEKKLLGQPSLLLLDEAWIMLGHEVFREKIREWLKVLRKANCAVVLATQSVSDASNSGILDVLTESCPTKIMLPNITAKEPSSKLLYQSLGLNDRQIEIISLSQPKRHYYYISPEGRRLFDLQLGPIALSFVGASGKEDLNAIKNLKDQYQDKWPLRWLQQRGVQYEDS
ncbi:MAG: conjugal transfer protein TrbE [Candidatus Margulisbacteria bacterium]|nr:conjugal transfer protein TrbE [Candidatus Margulisiibacteriota bacterium]